MRFILYLLNFLVVINTFLCNADEGMWLLPLIKELNLAKMQKMGLELSAEEIYNINNTSIKDAVVLFNNNCTGEMISEDGLLLTNHHCAYSEIQYHSEVGKDYITDGFWAQNREEELPNPGLSVTFLISIEDVTDKILPSLKDITDEEKRAKIINNISTVLIDSAVTGTSYNGEVYDFYEGNRFSLYLYETYSDVRLVGSPPFAIGKFGVSTYDLSKYMGSTER